MKIVTALCALLLLAFCCVSAASAGGMVKFHIPAVENAKVGDTVTVTLYNDNNLAPATGDLSIYLDWNMEVLKYESSTFKQGRTTAADIVGLHNLNIMAADTTNGFPQGDLPLVVMKFKVIGPGYTPIVIKVDKITDITGADISSKAVVKNGAVTATGTAPKTTTTTGTTTVATTGPVQTFTPLPTTVPVSGATTSPVLTPVAPVTAAPISAGPATVPFNTGVFSVTSIGNVPVGGIGTVQLVVDNAWQPLFADTYIDITFDPTLVRYLASSIHVANTTAAAPKDGTVRILLGDFRNGYPQGRYALADVSFTPLREGTTPLTVSVDHVRYWNNDFTKFTDISSSASTQSGSISTGPVASTVATLAPVTGNPSVTYDTLAPIGTVQTAGTPIPIYVGANNVDTDEYTGVTTKTATPTPTPTQTATEAPLPPTTVTTVTTPTPTANITLNTTVTTRPTTLATVKTPVPTTTKAALPFGVLAVVALAGVALVLQRTRR